MPYPPPPPTSSPTPTLRPVSPGISAADYIAMCADSTKSLDPETPVTVSQVADELYRIEGVLRESEI